jgi:hypothetical protein
MRESAHSLISDVRTTDRRVWQLKVEPGEDSRRVRLGSAATAPKLVIPALCHSAPLSLASQPTAQPSAIPSQPAARASRSPTPAHTRSLAPAPTSQPARSSRVAPLAAVIACDREKRPATASAPTQRLHTTQAQADPRTSIRRSALPPASPARGDSDILSLPASCRTPLRSLPFRESTPTR